MLETHERCSMRVLGCLSEVSHSHRRTLNRLEGQETSEQALVHESRWLTSLLEQDRERFVHQALEGYIKPK